MTVRRLLHAPVKIVLVMVATAAGAVAGGLLGMTFVVATMPGAGLEGLFPVLVGTVGGSVLGAFAGLAALFKLPRVQREYAMSLAAVGIGLLLIGVLGYVGRPRTGPDSALAGAALTCLPLGLLVAVTTVASLSYGPRPHAGSGD